MNDDVRQYESRQLIAVHPHHRQVGDSERYWKTQALWAESLAFVRKELEGGEPRVLQAKLTEGTFSDPPLVYHELRLTVTSRPAR